MDLKLLISSLALLGFAIFCGFTASSLYQDPIGVSFLMFLTFAAGVSLMVSLLGEKETSTGKVVPEDAKLRDDQKG